MIGHHRLVRVVDDAAAQPGVALGQPAPEVRATARGTIAALTRVTATALTVATTNARRLPASSR